MPFRTHIIAALFCLAMMVPAVSYGAAEEENVFAHSEAQVPYPDEFKAEFQTNIEDLFILSVTDDPEGTGARGKLLNSLKAMMGEGAEATGEESGTAPDVDLNKRRPYFTKQGWSGYMAFVKQSRKYMEQVAGQYDMGNGLLIMSGALDAKQRYWLGPEGTDRIVFTAKGRVSCRAMETVMCDTPFRMQVVFSPQDAESFSDVVISAWEVVFLNEKGRPVNRY